MKDIFELAKAINGEVLVDEKTLEAYSVDDSIFCVRPQAVVFPKDAEDVKALVKFAARKKREGEDVSLTARSAGTDMSGGPLNDSVIVSFTKYFNRIKEIGRDYAVVEPGVYFRDLEKELDKRGLMYPPYPASKDLCAIGGMVSNNSGGEKTLEYGKTENYVESLKIVLADGELHEIKPLSAAELQKKVEEKSFESEIYRKLYDLLEKNYDEIQKAKPQVSKNSAGYALWNVWSPTLYSRGDGADKKTFNIVKLIVGAQGTLGLVTEARLRLVKKKKFSRLVVIFSKILEPVPALVDAILPFKPESIESYDNKTLELALKFLPSLIKMMKGSFLKLAWDFLPEFRMALNSGFPKMVLLIELGADSEKGINEKIVEVLRAAKNFPVQARVTKDKDEEEKYWTIRRQSFALLHSRVKNLYAAPFVDDIIVKPEYMPEFLPKVNAVLDRYKSKLIYTIAGHPGNGNFHIIPLVNLKDPEISRIIQTVAEEIYKLVAEYNGSITAEHNDGLIRTPYLKEMYSPKILGLFEEVKKIFDPLGIFNPRKKTGGDINYSFGHLRES